MPPPTAVWAPGRFFFRTRSAWASWRPLGGVISPPARPRAGGAGGARLVEFGDPEAPSMSSRLRPFALALQVLLDRSGLDRDAPGSCGGTHRAQLPGRAQAVDRLLGAAEQLGGFLLADPGSGLVRHPGRGRSLAPAVRTS